MDVSEGDTANEPLPTRAASVPHIWDVIVIGGGAAGLMAAATAAARGRRTLVLEKNTKLGVKILMSGGTRCNITHHCGPREICREFGHGEKFLFKAVGQLPPAAVVALMEAEGVVTKIEDTGKVFPVSDRAIDVRDALWRRAQRAGVEFRTGFAVKQVNRGSDGFEVTGGTVIKGKSHSTVEDVFPAIASSSVAEEAHHCRHLIIACGGKSYPGCGTTGDGYAWARQWGHHVTPLHAALTPLTTDDEGIRQLAGITLENVGCRVWLGNNGKPLAHREGALLFTHTGLSGPEPMNLSRYVTQVSAPAANRMELDFFPGRSTDQLQADWRECSAKQGRSSVVSRLSESLPRRLVEHLMHRAGLNLDLRWADFSKENQKGLMRETKSCSVILSGTRGYDKAEVTAGGVELAEIDSRTMASRLVPGLFFCGEILDLDGPIGGYNFQAAFATGFCAGSHV